MWDLGDRNNTSFPQKVNEALRRVPYKEGEPLRYHQKLVHEYIKNSGVRGVLAYHSLGSGKSRLAAAVAVSALDEGRRVLFMSTKSLHDNFRADARKYIESDPSLSVTPEQFLERVEFITLNSATVLSHIQRATLSDAEEDVFNIENPEKLRGSLDNSFVIIDEAHNFFNSIANGAKQAGAIYHMIMHARDIRLLFLSGSPIINSPFEITICYNMLAGPLVIEPGVKGTLFSEHYDDFRKQFVAAVAARRDIEVDEDAPLTIANPTKFANRIVGLTSYFNALDSEIKHRFPAVLETKVVTVNMSEAQYTFYAEARDSELEEVRRAAFRPRQTAALQKPAGASSTYRIRSRQYSNFGPPANVYEITRDERNIAHYQFFIDRLTSEQLTPDGLAIIAPKVLALLQNCARHLPDNILKEFRAREAEQNQLGPGLVYSQFLDFGVLLVARVLREHGMMDLTPSAVNKAKDGSRGSFCVISGLIKPEERTRLIDVYNLPNNRDASVCALMLFTRTGAEGINTKRSRHVHILEPFWHKSLPDQVIGRAARMDSHADLPENERTVQPYIYLADYPLSVKNAPRAGSTPLELTTDITLYRRAVHNGIFIESFRRLLQEGAFDCSIHSPNADCRLCNPTDMPLFLPNIHKDLQNPDPCQPFISARIKARSVVVRDDKGNAQEFMYTARQSPGGRLEIHIYQYDPALGGYREVGIEHPLFRAIKAAIEAAEKKRPAED